MISRLQCHAVPITIGVSFFLFGFFAVANLVALSDREVVIGLISGAIGGLTILTVVLWSERKRPVPANTVC